MSDGKKNIFLRCCYGYAVSGMSVLVIGAVLPELIEEGGMSFTAAGGLLSVMAAGNLLASFAFPALVSLWGKRVSITLLTGLVPVSLLILTALPPLPVLWAVMLVYGIIRGAVTIMNNSAVNDIYEEKAAGKLNILHCSFAVGAFLAPFFTALFLAAGFGWRSIIYLLILLTCTSALSYGTLNYRVLSGTASDPDQGEEETAPGQGGEAGDPREKTLPNGGRRFLKSSRFYCIGFILFFYLGVENCINGWFVTYLQNTGVMSATYATTLVSFTWLVIMVGRLGCAVLTRRYSRSGIILVNAVGSCACFFLLISTKNLWFVTASLLGLGFFLAGIYPTCIANAGPLVKGSTLGMSLLTAISALGGIITPQVVGGAADRVGIVAAVSLLILNVIVVVVLAAANFRLGRSDG